MRNIVVLGVALSALLGLSYLTFVVHWAFALVKAGLIIAVALWALRRKEVK